jgi:cobalt-zinc-cadmium efflux system membrane fusion protein
MTEDHRLHVSPVVATIAVLSTLLAGAGGMYFLMRDGRAPDGARATAPTAAAVPEPVSPTDDRGPTTLPDVVVPLTKEAADRAGIELTKVTGQSVSDSLRLPGVVEPNAYRQVSITPLVGGRVVSVSAQLGDRVRKAQSLAQVYSPEVAEARTTYVSAKAMLDAHDRELQRTQKLVEIGAASRQELERIHAEHAAQTAGVESARSRLQLLGADVDESAPPKSQESATTNVPAPIDGIVTERLANVGLNVDPTTKLFTVVDLSNVWIVADVYERDLQRVREGARAMVTTTAYPDQMLEGRVSFIDPQLNTGTRTAKIRVEVANPRGDLRLGMFTDVTIASPGTMSVVTVPKDAIQSVGERQFAYLAPATDTAKFVEREVRVGRSLGERIEVLAGLSAGDLVVSKGSFFVRAEAERLGLRSDQSAPQVSLLTGAHADSASVQEAKILVTEKGFEPDRVRLRAGSQARLTFVRTTDQTCGKEVVFPSLNVKRTLPLNEPVAIEFTPTSTGDVAFVCGMNMLKGVVVVQ